MSSAAALLQSRVPVPTPVEVADLFAMLFGRECKGVEKRLRLQRPEKSVVAVYANDDGDVAAAILVEVQLAGGMGAALSMLPPHRAAGFKGSRQDDASITENLDEVLNVCASLFSSRHRVTLRQVRYCEPVDEQAEQSLYAFLRHGQRTQLFLQIKGYGEGPITLMTPSTK